MLFQHMADFLIWLVGCLHVIGCIGGLAFVVVAMIWLKRHPEVNEFKW